MNQDEKFKRKAKAAGWERHSLNEHLWCKGKTIMFDHDLAELLNEMDIEE